MYIPASPMLKIKYFFGGSLRHKFPIIDRDNFIFTSMGRNGFCLISKILGLNAGDQVLVPAFICAGALAPFEKMKIKIVYYDLRSDLSCNLYCLDSLKSSKTRLLVLVHYFGFPQDIREATLWAKRNNIATVEDCALSFGSRISGQYLGTYADFGLFSVRKFLGLPDGGGLLVNDPSAQRNCANLVEHLVSPRGSILFVVRALLASLENWLRLPVCKATKRLLWKKVDEVWIGEEIVYDVHNFNLGLSRLSGRILKRIEPWKNVERKRVANYQFLLTLLKGVSSIRPMFPYVRDGACPNFFPIFSKNKFGLLADLKHAGVPAIDWPDLPQEVSMNLPGFPITLALVKSLLLLPLHQDLDDMHLNSIARIISSHA